MPPCSVVIITHNYGQYLRRAIDSVLSQDFDGFELIVVDDGSQDDTAVIAASYGERIRFHRQDHAGPFAAARAGVHMAHAPWIVFVDADDRLRPGALANLHETAQANPDCALVLGRICAIDERSGTSAEEPTPRLSGDPLTDFANFASGRLRAPVAGGLIDAELLKAFDRSDDDFPTSMDLAILGLGLLRGAVLCPHVTLDVFAHEGRLRENVDYIHASGLKLADVLFDPAILPPEAMARRDDFVGFLERERSRAYHRAGWHSLAWRSYLRAVRATPRILLSWRQLRRFLVSLARAAMGAGEGPVTHLPRHPFLGHMRAFHANPVRFSGKSLANSNRAVRLDLQRRSYLLKRPSDIRHVLANETKAFQPAGITSTTFAGALLGTGYPRRDTVRAQLASAFAPRDIAGYGTLVEDVLMDHFGGFAGGDVADVVTRIRAANIAIAGGIVFGSRSAEKLARLDDLTSKSNSYGVRILRSAIPLPHWIPTRARRVIAANERQLDRLFESFAEEADGSQPLSFMERMIAQADEGGALSRRDIGRECVMLYQAACEPVAVTMAIALHRLGTNPDLQAQIVEEIENAGTPGEYGGRDTKTLTRLNRFLEEVHRLHPAEWMLTRSARSDERLPSGLLVRSGDHVLIDLISLHTDPDNFEDPLRFDPDRFEHGGIRSGGSYMPFGGGPSKCLGQALARIILSRALVFILRRWKLESLTDDIDVGSPNCFSTAILSPVPMRWHAR
ncbi:cytochrome P450 [Tepidamorphus sp. 3E244]|uniref:cytochrome P450 n=1 Tax=Tepidamorphus sp. 3E244 TaxID=3385498 RepID=UPI0038FC08BC